MFNEYVVEFPNGSTAKLFEFQILEDGAHFTTYIAGVVFDSRSQPGGKQIRGQASKRQIILQAQPIDVHVQLDISGTQVSIVGQVLERGSSQFLQSAEIALMRESMPLSTAVTDHLGEFKFSSMTQRGPVNIQILVRSNLWRILGNFYI
jgi:hypothetical protein